ncbi:MAG: RNA polymerase factor sigma-54 [Deltaproteobacteria bacterium]|nr:MAG: RNA polymerase factor sigma-54 [Deltaproteobacteria bacterium]
MALELVPRQEMKLTVSMTLQLQQAIKLLQLSRMELVQKIRQELEKNPALETADESTEKENFDELRELGKYLDSYDSRWRNIIESEVREFHNLENYTTYTESLTDHLLNQLLMTSPTAAEERIGSFIAGSLDQNGYLKASVAQIAAMSSSETKPVQKVLALMQTFDPPGVCARDLGECLLIQMGMMGMENSLAACIIQNHLEDLEKKNYRNICRALKAKMDDVVAAVKLIQSLEPRPGRQFDNVNPNYIVPDIFVVKIGKRYEIRLNGSGLPKLRFSSFCKNALAGGKKITDETKDYLKKKMGSAKWLIQSFYYRQITIYRVMESILKFQYDFFEKGIAHLKPMVLRDVAGDIGMAESTVSRINTKKYVQTPRGTFSLKYFFSSSVDSVNGEAIAATAVRDQIKHIIANEDPKKPLCDDKIAKILKAANIKVARRTVAKYRENLGILPSTKRKQF